MNEDLSEFFQWYSAKEKSKGPNLFQLAKHSMPGGGGRKGNKPKRNRSKTVLRGDEFIPLMTTLEGGPSIIGSETPSLGGGLPILGGGPHTLSGGHPTLGGRPPSLSGRPPTLGGGPHTLNGRPLTLSSGTPPTLGDGPPSLGNGPPSLGGGLPTLGGGIPTLGSGTPTLSGGTPTLGSGALASPEMSAWTTERLKKLLKEKGIPVSGLKHELVTKVNDFTETEVVGS